MAAKKRARVLPPLVLLTREAGKNRELARLLGRNGVDVVEAPLTITRPPLRPAPLVAVAADPSRWDWLVFTSARGVEAWSAARRRLRRPAFGPAFPAKIAVVGEGTAAAVRKDGGRVAFVPSDPRAAGLVAGWPGDPRGARILLVRPIGGRTEAARGLRARGAVVREVTAYRTVDAPLPEARLSRVAGSGATVVVVLAAPSAVAALARGLRRIGLANLRPAVVAIGPTTAVAAARLRPRLVEVATTPTDEALRVAVLRALARSAG